MFVLDTSSAARCPEETASCTAPTAWVISCLDLNHQSRLTSVRGLEHARAGTGLLVQIAAIGARIGHALTNTLIA